MLTFMSKQASSNEDEDDDDDDDSHDDVRLENSSLQDFWPNTVVQVHPPPNALC